MKSLALPQDLYWEGKLEANSPQTDQLFSIFADLNETALDDEDLFANDITAMCCEDLELKHDDLAFIQKVIGEELFIALYDLKEENFYSPQPLLENSIEDSVINPTQVTKVEIPYANNFGYTNHGAAVLTSLTPPNSPETIAVSPAPLEILAPLTTTAINNSPISISNVLQNTRALETNSPVQNPFGFANWNNNHHSTTDTTSSSVASSSNASNSSNYDIVFNTQIIDEILKTAANEFFEESESQSSLSTPSTIDYTSSDDEWMPSSGSCCSPSQVISTENLNVSSENSAAKKRTRPYGRAVEDRKKRKKEQNKNAATRYRQKKKLEMEIIQSEEQELSQRHEELKSQCAALKGEAKYLKKLIREWYSKKK